MADFVKNDKKIIKAWAVFDWANSAYALVISTAIFPIYFEANTPDIINFMGGEVTNSALYSYAISFSYILVALLSPFLSGMADYSGKRKMFLKAFTLVGSISCILLYFFKGQPDLWLGTSAFILATIGFSGGIVFYNSYLPQIVTEDRYDRVSAKGFAYGYVGSVILLLFILAMIQKPEWFGITSPTLPARLGFVLVGLWWIGFAQYTFKYLPQDSKKLFTGDIMKKGYQEIREVFSRLSYQPDLKKFLLSFFFYSAGVQTVIYLATIFAQKELNFGTAELIGLVLVLQIVGIGGAYFFAWVADKYGNKNSIIAMLIIWIAICIGAYYCQGKGLFYFLAAAVGLVMGGIQSVSRSSYSKMLISKDEDLTSYFSFYDVLYKLAIVAGAFFFGLVDNITHNMRYSILVLMVFFILGLIVLFMVNIRNPKVLKA